MTETVVEDLKQFIVTTLAQQFVSFRVEIDIKLGRLDKKIDELDLQLSKSIATLDAQLNKLDKKMDDISAGIAEAIEYNNERYDAWLEDHDNRIRFLERATA